MEFTQKHQNALNGFYDYMTEILGLYKDLVPMLKEEFDCIVADDTENLDRVMNSQQAILLKTRLFDENVAKFNEDIEVPSSSLAELISNLDGEEARRFSALQDDFRSTVEEVLFYRNKCKELLTTKLHRIGSVLEASGAPVESTTYDNSAAEVQTSMFPKSFQTSI